MEIPAKSKSRETRFSRRRFLALSTTGIVATNSPGFSLVDELTSLLDSHPDYIEPRRGEIAPPRKQQRNKAHDDAEDVQQPLFLTFDDGPMFCTAHILRHLAARKHRATFFVIGRNLANPKLRHLAVQALQEGHEIANHSYEHPNFSWISTKRAQKEITATHAIIEEIIEESGVSSRNQNRFFRFPYGDTGSQSTRQACDEVLLDLGYQIAGWDLDTNDWRMELYWYARSSAQVIGAITRAKPRDVVLLHDRGKTADHLPEMLHAVETRRLFSLPLSLYGGIEPSSSLALDDILPLLNRSLDR
jgi:peptidoglycan/xylan/chitin deacetylase (PgdA/CDA1 family)